MEWEAGVGVTVALCAYAEDPSLEKDELHKDRNSKCDVHENLRTACAKGGVVRVAYQCRHMCRHEHPANDCPDENTYVED